MPQMLTAMQMPWTTHLTIPGDLPAGLTGLRVALVLVPSDHSLRASISLVMQLRCCSWKLSLSLSVRRTQLPLGGHYILVADQVLSHQVFLPRCQVQVELLRQVGQA